MNDCVHEDQLQLHGWCKKAGYYCTSEQKTNCKYKKPKAQTKADCIRAMSDEQMAKVFSYTQYVAVKAALEQFGVNFECDQQSLEQMADEMLEQLQQPAEEG